MFNFEQSIAEWRRQMLAAGIKTPVPLEELESHLHEEIERRMKSGMNEQEAFKMAILQIGPGAELKTEFANDKGLLNSLLGDDKFTMINRILAVLWLIICWQHVASISRTNWWQDFNFSSLLSPHLYYCEPGILVYASAIFVYGVGAFGSALLFCGSKAGRNVVRLIAGFGIIVFIINKIVGYSWWPSTWAYILFNLVTIWLLNTRRPRNPMTAK